jgi:hypothetical protein
MFLVALCYPETKSSPGEISIISFHFFCFFVWFFGFLFFVFFLFFFFFDAIRYAQSTEGAS